MTGIRKSAAFALAAVMLASAASVAKAASATPDAAEAVAGDALPLKATLESKMRLVKLLLGQSPAVHRIPQSNNAQAKKTLAEAQALYAKATIESSAGHVESAIKLLDESLRQIVFASRLVPDAAQLAAQERAQNVELTETIRTFQTLQKNLSGRMAGKKAQTPAVASDIERINGMVEKAGALSASGNHHDANVALNSAYKIVVSTLNKMLMAETIVYDLKFESPTDEFQYELARNRSYEELIPIALAQLNTARETATLAERYVQQSRSLRDTAQQQAASGDLRNAVKTIQEATGHLQRSLRIAGVVVPQSPEIK